MNLTYKQIFVQEKNLQQTLYGQFGYKVESMNQIVQRKKKNDNFPVTANIKLRKVTPSLYKNQKIDQVQKQIEEIKKDRKRREEENKMSKNQDLNKYIDKMNHIVEQYNYLIDHKHIKEKGTEQARKMLNIRPKTEAEKAVEQIAILKEQLLHANFEEQFKLNRKINDLYRLFKDTVDQAPEKNFTRKRAISEQQKQQHKTQSFRVMSRLMQQSHRASSINSKPEVKKNQKYQLNSTMAYSLHQVKSENQKSENYLNISLNQGNLRKIKSHNADDGDFIKKPIGIILESSMSRMSPAKVKQQRQKAIKQKQNLQKSIVEPYVSKEFIESGKKMDIKIKNNTDALDLWKGRIAQSIPIKNQSNVKSKKNIQIEDNSNYEAQLEKVYNKINDQELQLKEHVPYIQNKKNFKHETVESLKMKNIQQEEILSSLLEKRNCKYLRPWGTKILVKYNSSKEAKEMLGLSPSKQPKQKGQGQQQVTSETNFNSPKKQDIKLKINLPFKQNEENEELDWNKQIDEEYYWTMCKNQKINLLLKGKRR